MPLPLFALLAAVLAVVAAVVAVVVRPLPDKEAGLGAEEASLEGVDSVTGFSKAVEYEASPPPLTVRSVSLAAELRAMCLA